MDTDLERLLDKMNQVYFAGGNTKPIWQKINDILKDVRMREYWGQQKRIEEIEERPFCLMSHNRVMAIIASLNEMTELFFSPCEVRESRVKKFLNSKADILSILALGVVNQTLRGGT